MLRACVRARPNIVIPRLKAPLAVVPRAWCATGSAGGTGAASVGGGNSAKPRRAAAGEGESGGGGWLRAGAGTAAVAAVAAGWWYFFGRHGNAEAVRAAAAEAAASRSSTDPSPGDLAVALGPDVFGGQALTLLLAMDELVLRRDWHPRFGWRVALRPGAKDFFRRLSETPGVAVTLWGDESSNTSLDVVNKMAQEFGFQVPFTQMHLGSEHCFTALEDDSEVGAARIVAPGAAPSRAEIDADDGLLARFLSLAGAALSRSSGAGTGAARVSAPRAKERHIEFFSRDQASILLVDTSPLSARINPHNTLIVKCVLRSRAEGRDVWGGDGASPLCAACRRTTTAGAPLRG